MEDPEAHVHHPRINASVATGAVHDVHRTESEDVQRFVARTGPVAMSVELEP